MFEKWIDHYAHSAVCYLLQGNVALALNELRNMTCHSIQTEDLRVEMDALRDQLPTLIGKDEANIVTAVNLLRRAALAAGPNNGARIMLLQRQRDRPGHAEDRFLFS